MEKGAESDSNLSMFGLESMEKLEDDLEHERLKGGEHLMKKTT